LPSCFAFASYLLQGKLKAKLHDTKLTFVHEAGFSPPIFTPPLSQPSLFSSDGNTEQQLRSLSAHAATLEQQLQNELRQAEVS
jgi:hypothetical protein